MSEDFILDLDYELDDDLSVSSKKPENESIFNQKGSTQSPKKMDLTPIPSETNLGANKPKAGRPAVKSKQFGKSTTVSWVTFESQKEVLNNVKNLYPCLTTTDILERAMALLVLHHNRFKSLDKVDISYAQDVSKTKNH